MTTKPYNPAPLHERVEVWLRNLWHWRTKWAVQYLSKQLRNDPGFRQSWHANISMPIYDATRPKCYCSTMLTESGLHESRCEVRQMQTVPRRFECLEMSIEQSNYIADRLMKHLFNA